MREISWLGEGLLDSQEELCSKELLTSFVSLYLAFKVVWLQIKNNLLSYNLCVPSNSLCRKTLCTLKLSVPSKFLYRQNLCTLKLSVPSNSLYHQTLCTTKLSIHSNSLYHQTLCTTKLSIHSNSLYHQTLWTLKLSVPSNSLYHQTLYNLPTLIAPGDVFQSRRSSLCIFFLSLTSFLLILIIHCIISCLIFPNSVQNKTTNTGNWSGKSN